MNQNGAFNMGKRRRFQNSSDLRRYYGSLINRTESGELDPALASKLGYLASQLSRIIEKCDHERRIEELERRVKYL